MSDVVLYDEKNIDTLTWPESYIHNGAKSFILPLIKDGASAYIKNVKTKIKLLKIDEFILPITINEKEYENSYVVSFYSVVGLLDEKIEKINSKKRTILRIANKGLSQFLKWIDINKVVIVNNWLFSTSLNPHLLETHVRQITDFLQNNFPDYMFVFRTINDYLDLPLMNHLKTIGYSFIETREVFVYDPKVNNIWSKRDCKRDLRMLKESEYEIIEKENLNEEDLKRALELYHQLYIEKYTKYSPQFTSKFMSLLKESRLLTLKAIKKNGKIDGVAGYIKMHNSMIIPFFGYDTTAPLEDGLYRITNILGLEEARKSEFVLNQSSGAHDFKKVRGLLPHQEYMAFRVKHLQGFRKMFWSLFNLFSNYILRPIIKNF